MKNQVIYSPQAPDPIGPYSQAIRSGHTLYVSGQIPIDKASGKLVDGAVNEEAEQVMKNLGAVLEAAGLRFADVVKCSIFLKSMEDFAAVNAVYGKYFESAPPARETVEVAGLPRGVRVEISCIAVGQ